MTKTTSLHTSYELSPELSVAIEITTQQADPWTGDHIVAKTTITLPTDGNGWLDEGIRFGIRFFLANGPLTGASAPTRALRERTGATHAEARETALLDAQKLLGELREMVRARADALEKANV